MTCLSCCSQTKRRSLLHRLREHLSRSSALTPRALSICSVWCGPLDGPCGPGLACFPTAAPCAGTKALSQNAFLRSLAPRSRETAAGATKIRSNMLVFARAFALAGKFGLVDTAPACLFKVSREDSKSPRAFMWWRWGGACIPLGFSRCDSLGAQPEHHPDSRKKPDSCAPLHNGPKNGPLCCSPPSSDFCYRKFLNLSSQDDAFRRNGSLYGNSP